MSTGRLTRTPVVLFADDDPGDQELTRRAFESCDVEVDLHVVEDGEEALDYLRRRGPYSSPDTSPIPDLLLLDLNMPRVDGSQVIREVREDPSLRRLPIVVMSTSRNIDDVNEAYAAGCNTFITKPSDVEEFMRVVGRVAPYWFRLVRLPRS